MNELLKILGSITLEGIANAISSSWIWFLNCEAIIAGLIIFMVALFVMLLTVTWFD